MYYYNKFKKIVSYLNFVFGIYLWILIIYAFFRSPLGELLLYPIKNIIDIF